MKKRDLLAAAGTAGLATLAGCAGIAVPDGLDGAETSRPAAQLKALVVWNQSMAGPGDGRFYDVTVRVHRDGTLLSERRETIAPDGFIVMQDWESRRGAYRITADREPDPYPVDRTYTTEDCLLPTLTIETGGMQLVPSLNEYTCDGTTWTSSR